MKKVTILFIGVFLTITIVSAQWITQNSGTSAFLTKVFFTSINTGYVVKTDGGLIKTTDGGNNWSQISPTETAINVFFTASEIGFATEGKKIKKTIDGGNSWIVKFSDSLISKLQIFFSDQNNGFVTGINNTLDSCFIYKTSDGGENWSIIGSYYSPWYAYPFSIFFTDNSTGYISSVMSIYKTIDGGVNWIEQYNDSNAFSEIQSVFFASKDTGCAVGGSIYWTFDGGVNWSKQSTLGNPLYSVFFTNNNVGYAVGGNGFNAGSVIKTTDGGNNWTLATSQTATFNSVFFQNPNIGYAVGSNGTIIKYTDTTTVGKESNNFIDYKESSIFPNPSISGIFRMPELMDGSHVTVTDMLGQALYQQVAESNNQVIDISSYPKGTYFVKVQTEEKMFVQKMIYQ